MNNRAWCGTVKAACLLVLLSGRAEAQSLQGRLLDMESNQPISAGIITLLDENGVRVTTTVTGESGAWLLQAPRPGIYFVEAKRLGYEPSIDGPVEIAEGDSWSSVYHLRALAVMLDPVEVSAEATRRYLELTGFFDRQRSDFGHYITPDQIEERQGNRITDLLTTIPGVRLVPTGSGLNARAIQLRGSFKPQAGLCQPRVFVDGMIFLRGNSRPPGVDADGDIERFFDENPDLSLYDGLSIDDVAHPSTVAAIEVYRSGAQVPVQFGGTSIETQCGVIVIWTRVGRMRGLETRSPQPEPFAT
ncbi:MAG: TonB-dependent receptor [Gemmatimonadetes bacterium]|nr:TonB-dependent receptor [Gemmatimonadota bacterium]